MKHEDSEDSLAAEVVRILSLDTGRCEVLRSVEDLHLPECWVGAGFVRNAIWDHLHGYTLGTPLNDIDVAYFDPLAKPSQDKLAEARLNTLGITSARFSVKNQAHMSERNHHLPYRSTLDAISRWTEGCTCVAARFADSQLEVFAAFGWGDLFDLIVRPNGDSVEDQARALARVSAKGWLQTWPKLCLGSSPNPGGTR